MTTKTHPLDQVFMRAALVLARRGLGMTHPNPTVGCILVRTDLDNRVVGRGWTQLGGRPHAETVALQQAGEQAKGASAYVTLEPCCHYGQTPPCSDALVSAGVSRVVIALKDPDPRVAGQGITALKNSKLTVLTGICSDEAREVNAGFISLVTRERPLFTLKTATTLDGKSATLNGESQWITGTESRAQGHRLRASHDAILTGARTITVDNPMMNCRLPGCENRSPVRVILDSKLTINPEHAIIRTSSINKPVWIFTSRNAIGTDIARQLKKQDGVQIFTNENGTNIEPEFVSQILAKNGLTRVLIESGGKIAASFLKANMVDSIVWFRAGTIIGGDGQSAIAELGLESLALAKSFVRISARQVGPDMMETYSVVTHN